MIYINHVFQYVTDSKRIRVIDIEEPHVYIVNIDTSSAMPRKELYSSLATDIKQGELLAVSDPYAKVISEYDLTEVQIRKREEDWGNIQRYCIPNMPDLLEKQGREGKIREIVQESNLGKTKVKKLLTRYWQRGMTKNAMLPDYSNSGGKGKTKTLTKEKVGRPRKVNINNEYQTSINITNKKQRKEEKIHEIVQKSNVGKTKIKKLLTRYWQRGMTKNAMLPDYSNSGGKGKTKTLTKEKVGRPRKVNINNEYQTGINITDEVKVQIEHVINKYYRKKNNYSLKDVYHFMLRDFYSNRYKENGELKYRIWDATRTPTYHQFYYCFKKLRCRFVKVRKNMSLSIERF